MLLSAPFSLPVKSVTLTLPITLLLCSPIQAKTASNLFLAKREIAKLEATMDAKVHTLSIDESEELAHFAPKVLLPVFSSSSYICVTAIIFFFAN